jgi:hypothetical protein
VVASLRQSSVVDVDVCAEETFVGEVII